MPRSDPIYSARRGSSTSSNIGIGLFLLLIASNDVGLVIKNPGPGLPVSPGHITAFPVLMSVLGLAAIFKSLFASNRIQCLRRQ